MFKKTNSKEFSAPRRKVGKEKSLSFSPNLAPFAPLPLDSPPGPEVLEGRESSFPRFRNPIIERKTSIMFG
jgi:hypothetical protein